MNDNAGAIINYTGYIFWFKYKVKIIGKTSADGNTKYFEIMKLMSF